MVKKKESIRQTSGISKSRAVVNDKGIIIVIIIRRVLRFTL